MKKIRENNFLCSVVFHRESKSFERCLCSSMCFKLIRSIVNSFKTHCHNRAVSIVFRERF